MAVPFLPVERTNLDLSYRDDELPGAILRSARACNRLHIKEDDRAKAMASDMADELSSIEWKDQDPRSATALLVIVSHKQQPRPLLY
jgi:hypothetical protein